MELKFQSSNNQPTWKTSFNRTFMELKCGSANKRTIAYNKVLIVPLWNWNRKKRLASVPWTEVLIVPLWNWNEFDRLGHQPLNTCFNRTFMELKCGIGRIPITLLLVLIVPLWNWNMYYAFLSEDGVYCFNRTFMELKCVFRLWEMWWLVSFNRTFMELKYRGSPHVCKRQRCFNRTFMELKCIINGLNINADGEF